MADNEATLLIRIKQLGGDVLDKVGEGIAFVAERSKAAGLAIVGFAAAGVHAFREQELATNQLSQAMVQQGMFTAELRDEYVKQAEALQQLTTYGDEQIISAQAILQAHIGNTKVSKELTQATLDYAAATGKDVASAAEAMGKSIGTSTNALARNGIELDANMQKNEKMSAVIEAVNAKYGGQAAAVALNLGSMDQLKNTIGDLLEVLGEKLAPFISFFVKQLNTFSQELKNNGDFVKGLEASVLFLSKGFSFLKNMVLGTTEVIAIGLSAAIESVSLAIHGQFSKAKDIAKLGMDEVARAVIDRKNTFNEELAAIDEQTALTEEAKKQQDLLLTQQSEENKTNVIKAEAEKRAQIAKDLAAKEFKVNQEKVAAENAFAQAKANIVSASAALITELTGSGSKAAFYATKAAALAQAWVATNLAAAQALAVPPSPNLPLASMARTAGNISMAAIAASTIKGLATGGIVSSKPGGTPFILGEGGQDEAVIPLENGKIPGGGGGGTTIIFNGPILGDESQAMEFARAIDKNLLKLRQTNQSVAFETDIF